MKAVALALSLLSLNAWAISKEDIGALNELFIKTIEKNEKRANTGVAVSVFTVNEIIMQNGYGYALGWMTNTMNPQASWFFHGGNIDGFSAMVLFSYELNVGIVVLVNDNASDLNDLLVTNLLRYELACKPVGKDFNSIKKRFLFPKLDQINLASLPLTTKSEKVMDEVTLFENPGYGVLKSFSKECLGNQRKGGRHFQLFFSFGYCRPDLRITDADRAGENFNSFSTRNTFRGI